MAYLRMSPDPEWAAERVSPFPLAWAKRLLDKWGERHSVDRTGANLDLLHRSKTLRQAWAAGLSPDAGDSDIVQRAKDAARDMARRLRIVEDMCGTWAACFVRLAKLREARRLLEMQHLADVWDTMRDERKLSQWGRLQRVQCERWWRRVLRRLHARTVEACAIGLGLVHKRGHCYVSNEGLKQRRAQLARNAAGLQATHAINDAGQAYTLAELAAKGTSNAEIRRAELMTRIAGFELIARDCTHVADFITVTCPSRMHSHRQVTKWRSEPNPKYDGTKPDEAQAYLSQQWARLRAWWDRRDVKPYGFRIAEPNHDGTPHWHMLVFYPEGMRADVHAGLRRYFLLNDSPTERGAEKHRITCERIDWKRGSAAGYIAKYVSKNIDGYRVDVDLYGNPAMEASERVQAWAARWRIRQFQQIGGAPVTVWRELRRLNPEVLRGDEADSLEAAIAACNTSQQSREALSDAGQRHTAALGWQQYVMLQGGPTARRELRRVRLARERTGEIGRYGEAMPAAPVGVVALGKSEQWVSMPLMPKGGYVRSQRVETLAQSERSMWFVVPGASKARAQELARERGAAAPWTRVNNCTHGQGGGVYDVHPEALFGTVRQVRPKLGRVFNWARGDDARSRGPIVGGGDGIPSPKQAMPPGDDDAGQPRQNRRGSTSGDGSSYAVPGR